MAQIAYQKRKIELEQNNQEFFIELPKSIQEIYFILKQKGPQTPKEISLQTSYAPRTLRYALKKLMELNMIKKFPKFDDLRQNFYTIQN